ncbi:hypothetical protein PDE_09798 [Penicillium oxalicum 114-2]|uniref:Putative zinc-finger domain-containing protein n=1 Tax=Penicillium oxalicum (strain 114-2 / CGMCC 5302) TaxID=933388 RepID=S7ZWN1_PENO1|nr:hypothetical protein PDE_09798 [Penicillium oxalicum 114-2]
MANQPPPPFGGYQAQAQQWPFLFPPMIPANFTPTPDMSSTMPQALPDPSQAFQFGFLGPTGSHGLSAPGNFSDSSMPRPPKFPFGNSVDISQFQQSTSHLPFAGYVAPQAQGHAGFSAEISRSSQQRSSDARNHEMSRGEAADNQVPQNSSREEGEISEGEIVCDGKGEAVAKPQSSTRVAKRQRVRNASISASPSSSSTRSSSPYNPPLSVSVDAGTISSNPTRTQSNETGKTAITSSTPNIAPSLRVQAQGALLSLAPHNIRFNELVAEGINPVILRKLYEEVGIRVESSQPSAPVAVIAAGAAEKHNATGVKTQVEILPRGDSTPRTSNAESDTKQPMERKELIAKMLAAKAAARNSQPAASKSSPEQSHASVKSQSSPTNGDGKAAEKIAPIKEKNKAQTELARQRIEELKKQALLRSQQKARQEAQGQQDGQTVQGNPPPAVHHPLPVRPPAPRKSAASTIPGLSLAKSTPAGDVNSTDAPPSGNSINLTPFDRPNLRKRPRASDFDDSGVNENHISHATPPLSYNNSDRLIIHISDDESLYGDDEVDKMDMGSNIELEPANEVVNTSVNGSQSAFQQSGPGTGVSTTPQPSTLGSDPEQMRQRTLEIQALHRKIAEMEEKRKAKLAASRTQSPLVAVDTAATPVVSGAASAVEEANHSDAATTDQGSTKLAGEEAVHETQEEEEIQPGQFPSNVPTTIEASADTVPSTKSLETSNLDVPAPSLAEEGVAPGQAPVSTGSDTPGTEAQDTSSEDSSSDETSSESASDVSMSEDSSSDDSSAESESAEEDNEVDVPETNGVTSHPNVANDGHMQVDSVSNGISEETSSPALVDLMEEANGIDEAEEDDYEPTDNNGHDHDMSDAASSPDSEAYEPPEPDTGMESPHSSYSPPPPDIEAKSTDVDLLLDSFEKYDPQDAAPRVVNQEAQPVYRGSESDILGINTPSNPTVSNFTAYVSPLRYFKAYRYHPRYTNEVSDGYRSLTYSNDINPMKYLCKYEFAGGVCNDRSCQFQHFRDMSLSDDNILIEMGSVREGRTKEEKEAYLAGLKGIINDLRRDKVKDFSTVASEIASYRRRFLQDESRVLPL